MKKGIKEGINMEKEALAEDVCKGRDTENLNAENARVEDGENKNSGTEKRKQMATKVHETVAAKIWDYIERTGLTQESFAARINVSSSTVNRWLAGRSETSLPPVYKLREVAHELGITVDSLLGGDEISVDRSISNTYANAFLTILELVDKGIVAPVSTDPFLSQLLYRKIAIDGLERVDKEKKEKWLKKVLTDYDAPILPRYLTQYINLFKREYEEIEEYDTYLTVFHLFQGYADGATKKEVDQLIEKWKTSVLSGSDEYKHVSIPWDSPGSDSLVALDENGNTYLEQKPKPMEQENQSSTNDGDFFS